MSAATLAPDAPVRAAVRALDHVNIRVASIAATTAFYRDVLGMTAMPVPGMEDKPDAWICDGAGRAILHVGETPVTVGHGQREDSGGPGPVHHVALDCVGHADMLARLDALGIASSRNRVASAGLDQVFVRDPDGILIELNFRSG